MMTTKQSTVQPRRKILGKVVRWGIYALLATILLLCTILTFFRGQAALRETQARTEAAPSTGQFFQAGDVEIFVQEMGPKDGPPVLFIHGTGAWSEIWRETMVELSEAGYRTIAVDLPPFGFSERPSQVAYGRNDQAQRILGVLNALEVSEVTLVGHSFGGGG
ncbi:MAG: alpha/beta fold hydrolase, partial [Chloroflexota bacterium]